MMMKKIVHKIRPEWLQKLGTAAPKLQLTKVTKQTFTTFAQSNPMVGGLLGVRAATRVRVLWSSRTKYRVKELESGAQGIKKHGWLR